MCRVCQKSAPGADARKSSNGIKERFSLIETITMAGSDSSTSREEGAAADLVECVHCHRLTPTANGPASSYPDTGDTADAL